MDTLFYHSRPLHGESVKQLAFCSLGASGFTFFCALTLLLTGKSGLALWIGGGLLALVNLPFLILICLEYVKSLHALELYSDVVVIRSFWRTQTILARDVLHVRGTPDARASLETVSQSFGISHHLQHRNALLGELRRRFGCQDETRSDGVALPLKLRGLDTRWTFFMFFWPWPPLMHLDFDLEPYFYLKLCLLLALTTGFSAWLNFMTVQAGITFFDDRIVIKRLRTRRFSAQALSHADFRGGEAACLSLLIGGRHYKVPVNPGAGEVLLALLRRTYPQLRRHD